MDKFEQFFKENRLRLDDEDFSPDAWENIETSIKTQRKKLIISKLYIAAGILLILSLGFTLLLNKNSKSVDIQNQAILTNVSAELAEQELNYIHAVNERINVIKQIKIPKENAKMFKEFVQQLKIIDQQYEEYKQELKKNGYNTELIQQIIYNYQLKLSVLQMLQNEMNKINNLTKNRKNEKNREETTLEI